MNSCQGGRTEATTQALSPVILMLPRPRPPQPTLPATGLTATPKFRLTGENDGSSWTEKVNARDVLEQEGSKFP